MAESLKDEQDDIKIITSPREDLTKAKIEKIISMCDTRVKEESAARLRSEEDQKITSQEQVECSLVRNYGSEDLFSLKQFTSGETEAVAVPIEKNAVPSEVLKDAAKKIQDECSISSVKKKGKSSICKKEKASKNQTTAKLTKDKPGCASEEAATKDVIDTVDTKELLDLGPFIELESSETSVDDRFLHKNTASMTNFFIFNDLNTSDVVWTYDEYMGKKPVPCQSPRRSNFWQRLRNHLKLSSSTRHTIRPIVSRLQKQPPAVRPSP